MVENLKTRVARVAQLLNRSHVEYVVVGAEACNVRGVVRATKDVDILLKKDPKNVERALKALGQLTFGIAKEILPEEVLKKPFTIIGDTPRVDLLFRAGKLKYEEAMQDVEEIVIEGVKIPFAGLDSLMKSKDTDRAKDLADLEVLKEIKQKSK